MVGTSPGPIIDSANSRNDKSCVGDTKAYLFTGTSGTDEGGFRIGEFRPQKRYHCRVAQVIVTRLTRYGLQQYNLNTLTFFRTSAE